MRSQAVPPTVADPGSRPGAAASKPAGALAADPQRTPARLHADALVDLAMSQLVQVGTGAARGPA